ncbi:hypothetical protein FHX42_001065 [Saccharopolyspora lacisalsi]|uniref:Uncharacterized protein n=1 Tax=Halosaccharopolyspora lacisalsi TaxID=1000566 RepID=A0A839DTX8_9PSEU|nr:hypothetical protein [Halosaccharopolyspora lacisalsi]MBA8823736.1 hypothetical protein [Halosaccharopolyspora lacisalsi]
MQALPEGPYSYAPRCEVCDERAALTEDRARTLVAASGERLTSYSCPIELSIWHVWYPAAEHAKQGPTP